jgi:hypothetical protein
VPFVLEHLISPANDAGESSSPVHPDTFQVVSKFPSVGLWLVQDVGGIYLPHNVGAAFAAGMASKMIANAILFILDPVIHIKNNRWEIGGWSLKTIH